MHFWTVGSLDFARAMLFYQLAGVSLFLKINYLRTLGKRNLTLKCLQVVLEDLWHSETLLTYNSGSQYLPFSLMMGLGLLTKYSTYYAGVVLLNSIVIEQLKNTSVCSQSLFSEQYLVGKYNYGQKLLSRVAMMFHCWSRNMERLDFNVKSFLSNMMCGLFQNHFTIFSLFSVVKFSANIQYFLHESSISWYQNLYSFLSINFYFENRILNFTLHYGFCIFLFLLCPRMWKRPLSFATHLRDKCLRLNYFQTWLYRDCIYSEQAG